MTNKKLELFFNSSSASLNNPIIARLAEKSKPNDVCAYRNMH
jgi:hypothetical protein